MSHSDNSLDLPVRAFGDSLEEQVLQWSPNTYQDSAQSDVPHSSIDPSRCFIDKLSAEILRHIFLTGHSEDSSRHHPYELVVS